MIVTCVNGELRCLVEDDADSPALYEQLNSLPERASDIGIIQEGRLKGWWFVDFSRVAKMTDDPSMSVCLAHPFRSRREAIEAEIAWMKQNFLGINPNEAMHELLRME